MYLQMHQMVVLMVHMTTGTLDICSGDVSIVDGDMYDVTFNTKGGFG